MSTVVTNGYESFTDTDGTPLEEGYIFIGQPNLNPISNPKQAYWDNDRTSAANNIRTTGGYPAYQGAPGRLYVDGAYSILVQNRGGEQVYLQLVSLNVSEDQTVVTNPDLAGGLPLGSILPKTGVTFTGFLALGTAGLSDATYPDLAASGIDYVSDNGDGTFDLLDSGETTGWVANAAWANQGITITHDLLKNMTDLDIEVYVSSAGTEATAIKVLDTAFDQAVAAAEFNGISLQGIGNASFTLRTGTNGVSVVNTDGTQIILVAQNWYYKVNMRRKDAPYPAQISYVSLSSEIDGGSAPTQIIALRLRRDTDADWTSGNPVLELGEAGYATDTGVLKVGDGSTVWNSLAAVNTGITATLTGVIGTDRTFLENDAGTLKVSLGSVIEADGTLYTVTGSAATPSGTPADGTYLFFDPSGGTYTWSATAGTQSASKGGYYDGSDRRQCRWRLTSATTYRLIVGEDASLVDGDLDVSGDFDVAGSLTVGGSVGALSIGELTVTGEADLQTGRIAAGTLHGTKTANEIFDAVAADLATGDTRIVTGAIISGSSNLTIMSYVHRNTATQVTFYGISSASGPTTLQFDDAGATSYNISITW
jgi:hypothetical protein